MKISYYMISMHCIISGGEYAAELSKDEKRAVQRKASMLVVQKDINDMADL